MRAARTAAMGATTVAAGRATGTVGKRAAERAEARLVEMVAMVVREARGVAPMAE
jgi:hypothetical protein